ncbi:hypothetical protein ACIQVO_37210 [Streptomyces sp. NPDC101062]|uniref:hypothetical protein n=1 Tax=unclassified Streptomyces TaxID=2593676 RepID=UPI002E7AA562|nr:hypothetical protein [Streptomyces sp. JV176]MEE1798126.1 hypothetical protein [Streptomyces sp. JV176]
MADRLPGHLPRRARQGSPGNRLARLPPHALVLNHDSRTSAELLAKTADELLAE